MTKVASTTDDVTNQMEASRDVAVDDALTFTDSPSYGKNPGEGNDDGKNPTSTTTDVKTESSATADVEDESSNKTDDVKEKSPTDENENDDSNNEDEDEAEEWDIKAKLPDNTTEVCSNNECNKKAVATWHDIYKPDGDLWHSCLDCQKNDFDVDDETGWPEGFDPEQAVASPEPSAATTSTTDVKPPAATATATATTTTTTTSSTKEDSSTPPVDTKEANDTNAATTTNTTNDNDQQGDDGEKWDLKAVLGARQIRKEEHKCQTEGCGLVACSIWVTNGSEDEPWYSCLDCQEKDFEGFPPVGPELPVKALKKEHKSIIAEKCSRQDNPKMPNLPEPAPQKAAVTPPPGKELVNAAGTKAQAAAKKGSSKGVTPSPVPPRGAGGKKSSKTGGAKLTAIHQKWQDAADKLGGPGSKVIVKKDEVKKVVFNMLHDSFCPMNINEIYNELKGTIPSMILSSCLDDMALDKKSNPFDESSDEEDDDDARKKKKKKTKSDSASSAAAAGDSYAGSLSIKQGRNINNILYFVNHTSSYVKNGGNGLPPDERQEFLGEFEAKKSEVMLAQQKLKDISAQTAQLLSEPTNEELESSLEVQEQEMEDLSRELEASRALKENEKIRRKIVKKVDSMTTTWRKRKRITMDFLIQMEENTEGTISVKKCLAGDAQIEIDSDEVIVSLAKKQRQQKKARPRMVSKKLVSVRPGAGLGMGMGKSGGGTVSTAGASHGCIPDPDFVGVVLDSSGNVSRVMVDEEN